MVRSFAHCIVVGFLACFSVIAPALVNGAPSALAASGDSEANRLARQAMEDYEKNRFLKAEGGLKTAAAVCRSSTCSETVQAKLWGYLGIVYSGGLEDMDAATACFQQMLMLDRDAEPEDRYSNPAVKAAFEAALEVFEADERAAAQAKEEERRAKEEEQRRIEEAQRQRILEHQARVDALKKEKLEEEQRLEEERRLEAERQRLEDEAMLEEERKLRCDVEKPLTFQDAGWVEQAIGFPVPVFIKPGELPSDTMKIQEVFIEYKTPKGQKSQRLDLKPMAGGYGGYLPCDASAQGGDLTYTIQVVNSCGTLIGSSGSASKPRTIQLKPAIDFKQPHLPGQLPPATCVAQKGMSCEIDDECPGDGARCEAGFCTASKPKVAPEERIHLLRHRLSFSAGFDLSPISSNEACSNASREEGQYSCFLGDGAELEPNMVDPGGFSTVGPGNLRLSLGYDHVFGARWLVGGRAGLTLMGHPKRADGESVLPFHAEGRGAVYFGEAPFERMLVRAYAYIHAGLGEASGRVNGVTVRRPTTGLDQADVWQKGGNLFAGGGFGLEIPIFPAGAISVQIGAKQYFPNALTAFGPSLGYVHGL